MCGVCCLLDQSHAAATGGPAAGITTPPATPRQPSFRRVVPPTSAALSRQGLPPTAPGLHYSESNASTSSVASSAPSVGPASLSTMKTALVSSFMQVSEAVAKHQCGQEECCGA